jgi:sugar phosphate isomerase/epimerase
VAAGDLVYRANCPNIGLAIDAFDVLAARVPRDDLDAIDPEQIFLVQLSDYMWQEILTLEEQASTATHFRVFPGEGAHSDDLAAFVTKLDAIGYMGNYSFDVYNDDYQQMPPETVVDRARRAAEWLVETVLRRALPVPNMERLRHSAGP